ncbi:hypothetical protein [Methylobacterium gregans]|uniref:hypothetical protein n=1 Tax=Methylobacterium gregans TaxID=374424 RepID=UPI001EE29A14|nr:hypothetical protein [Methylobacterium gregans]MDQ0521402.1 hypothetical protein [Methylobacterium gregans]
MIELMCFGVLAQSAGHAKAPSAGAFFAWDLLMQPKVAQGLNTVAGVCFGPFVPHPCLSTAPKMAQQPSLTVKNCDDP